MKTVRVTAGGLLVATLVLFLTFVSPIPTSLASSETRPQSTSQTYSTLDKGYYITVGAFAKSKYTYAEKFVEKLKSKGYAQAAYGLDAKRNILLVYLDKYEAYDPSIDEMLATRKRTEFAEAWVRIIKDPAPVSATATVPASDPSKETPTKEVIAAQPSQPRKEEPVLTEVKEPADTVAKTIPAPTKKEEKKEEPKGPPSLQNTPVLFNMYDANNSRLIDGSVEIVDTQRARLMKTHKSSDTVMIPNPNSDTGIITLITDVFGYRKVQHEISYKVPLADTSKHYFDLEDGYFVAHFEMVRYHRGDIATLYHVYFYNDAAIMQPESRYELNKLLDMMQSNPNYRIRLHGHTNGNSFGKIISMGPSKDFFSVNVPDVKEGSGSSKALSGQRAEVIKEWLVAQGIAAERMEVKAWGGKRMLHDRNSNNARKNVRVEVEVLAE